MTPSALAFWERCFSDQFVSMSGYQFDNIFKAAAAAQMADACVVEREKRWHTGHSSRCGVTADGSSVCVIGCREQQKAEEATELEVAKHLLIGGGDGNE